MLFPLPKIIEQVAMAFRKKFKLAYTESFCQRPLGSVSTTLILWFQSKFVIWRQSFSVTPPCLCIYGKPNQGIPQYALNNPF